MEVMGKLPEIAIDQKALAGEEGEDGEFREGGRELGDGAVDAAASAVNVVKDDGAAGGEAGAEPGERLAGGEIDVDVEMAEGDGA